MEGAKMACVLYWCKHRTCDHMIPSSILVLTVHQTGWYLISGLVKGTCKVTGLCGLDNRTNCYEKKNYARMAFNIVARIMHAACKVFRP